MNPLDLVCPLSIRHSAFTVRKPSQKHQRDPGSIIKKLVLIDVSPSGGSLNACQTIRSFGHPSYIMDSTNFNLPAIRIPVSELGGMATAF